MKIGIASYIVLAVAFVLGFLLLQQNTAKEVQRNTYGAGSRTEEYTAIVEGEKIPVQVQVSEQQYETEEVQTIFAEVMKKLDTLILGENSSLDRIENDMKLVSAVEGYPVQIEWELSSYEFMDLDGTLRQEALPEEGALVELQAYLSLQEQEALYVRSAMIYPQKEQELSLGERLSRLLREKNEETKTEEKFHLPESIDGKTIKWKAGTDYSGYVVWAMGLLSAILLILRKKEKEKEEKKKIEEEMLQDYPKILSTFTLLLETGMTVKNAWIKIIQNYEKHRQNTGERRAYMEMCETYHRMQSGVAEATAYEQFGNQCGLIPYRKFGVLLSQNLRKGSKGLAGLLLMESIQATEEKKNNMKQKAEVAGTKLLLPMFAMLGVVLIMVIAPAFMTMQL